MKKTALILSVFFLFLGSGCNYFKYAKYPKVQVNEYDGYVYIHNQIDLYKGYFMVYDNLEIIGRRLDLLNCWSIDYFSNRDVEKNWRSGNGYMQEYANALKEGFELPNILDSKLLEMRIPCGDIYESIGVKIDEGETVICFDEEITLQQVIDLQNRNENIETDNKLITCYFVLREFPYLAWGNRGGIVLYQHEIYLFCNYWIEENIYGYDSVYYKIKDEYQEVFRNAIKEFNNA